MTRPKARVRRENGEWVASRPTLGFGAAVDERSFTSWPEAMRWLDQAVGRGAASQAERATAPAGVGMRSYGANRDMHVRA